MLTFALGGEAPVRPSHLHAVIARAFDHTAAEHRAKSKPYALGQVSIAPGQVRAEVNVLDDTLSQRFIEWLVEFGATAGRFGANPIALDPDGGVQLVATDTYEDLAFSATPATRWTFEFLTPTTFRQGRYASQPLPVANSVFGGLRHRWELFGGTGRLDLNLDTLDITAEDFDISTVANVSVRDRPVRAFVGVVTYACFRPPEESAHSVDLLARFAEYCGVGAYTPFGMGCVRLRR